MFFTNKLLCVARLCACAVVSAPQELRVLSSRAQQCSIMNKRPATLISEPLRLTPISADLFFPAPSLEWKQKLQSLLQKSPEKPDAVKKPAAYFRTFPKQDLAFEFVDRSPEVSHVFSYETGAGAGSRKFLASSYEDFWNRYSEMSPESRVHYEVIREDTPCHLYFDLEFKRSYNPDKDGDKLRDIFCKIIWEHLSLKYSVNIDDRHTIILDSSTEKKFSNHVIVNIPHCAFTNNIHAGAFVREVYTILEAQREYNPDVESLFLDTDKDKMFIADMGVYTRNRNFRLFLSSKHGQNSYLTYVNKTGATINAKDIFYKSLICNIEFSSNLRLLTHGEVGKSPNKKIATNSGPQSTHFSSGITTTRSPFPEIDDFIATKISRGGVPGSIRSVIFFPTSKVIVYGIGNNRYCENIGRAHKSNHTLMVCDCQGGVYYQRCYDYDCRNFRGHEYPLPLELCPFRSVSAGASDDTQQDLGHVLEQDTWLLTDEEIGTVQTP